MDITDYKYEEVDFGFTAVDEEELKVISNSVDSEVVQQIATNTSDNLLRLDEKLDSLLEMQHDIMSELIAAKNLYDEKSSGLDVTKEVMEDKLLRLERLIMPLLSNLLKNKDKEYIYWPNREPIIKAQMDKVLEITRGE